MSPPRTVTFEFTDAAYATLTCVAAGRPDSSIAQLLGEGIGWVKLAAEVERCGGRLIIEERDGTLREIVESDRRAR